MSAYIQTFIISLFSFCDCCTFLQLCTGHHCLVSSPPSMCSKMHSKTIKVILLSIHYNIYFLVICCWGLKRRIVISLSRKERELDTYLYLGHCTACHIETSGLWSQVSAEGKWGEEKWSTRLISKPTLKKKKITISHKFSSHPLITFPLPPLWLQRKMF